MKLQKLAKQIDKSRFTISDADEILCVHLQKYV